MGSDSDYPVMKEAVAILKSFNIAYEVTIVSAQEHLKDYLIMLKRHMKRN